MLFLTVNHRHLTHLTRVNQYFCVLLLISLVTGCTALKRSLSILPGVSEPDAMSVRYIHVVSDADANSNSGTAVDFLFIHQDPDLSKTLPKTAREWFSNRAVLENKYHDQVTVVSIEIAPQEQMYLPMPEGYKNTRDIILYANYLSPKGQNWLRVVNEKHVRVSLQAKAIKVEAVGK